MVLIALFFFFFFLQDLLTRHKVLVAEFLEQNYDVVIYTFFWLLIFIIEFRKTTILMAVLDLPGF